MRRSLSLANALLLVCLLIITAACGSEAPTYTAAPARSANSGAAPTSPPAPAPPTAPAYAPAAAATSTTAAASAATEPADSAPGSADAGAPAINYGLPNPETYQSPLTAGQVDDNARFAEYLNYLRAYEGPPALPIAVQQRVYVRVVDGEQHPVAGARVQLFDGDRPVFDGRTVSDGRVLFFPQAAQAMQVAHLRAVVSRGQTQVEATLPAGQPEATVSLDKLTGNDGPVGLDLVFLLDATGSMGDEIAAIKATVAGISARIEQLPGSSTPRFGLVAYRDRGDEYVTRAWDFTPDVQQFQANLTNVTAAGGGDTPESVNAGLQEAIHLPGWAPQEDGRHLRLVALVGDAPPHLDYANDYEYPALLQEAVGAGIKIFPIGASGLDEQGEYIFRQFAEVTQGQFVFLTYANGESGAPGAGTDNHVSEFSVDHLDSLVVRLVAGEIANQTGSGNPGAAAPVAPVVAASAPPERGAGTPLVAWLYIPLAALVISIIGAFTILTSTAVPVWAWLIVIAALWLGWGLVRGRRARGPATPFAAPVSEPRTGTVFRARGSRQIARVANEPTRSLAFVEPARASTGWRGTARHVPTSRDTAPLPPAAHGVRPGPD